MKGLFLLGWQSIRGGVKPTFLAWHGHGVVKPYLAKSGSRSTGLDHGTAESLQILRVI
jgi:hypothetical protein